MEEIWKDIPGYEGEYQVSNYGNIKSLSRRLKNRKDGFMTSKTRMLKTSPAANGYPYVSLRRRGKNHTVHRLVAMCFIDNPESLPCVNHKDGNRANNIVSNLEWVTYSDNAKHAYRVLGKKLSPAAFKKGWSKKEIHPIDIPSREDLEGIAQFR